MTVISFVGLALLPGVAHGGGAGVQVVAGALAVHLRQAGDAVDIRQLVHGDAVVDVGRDVQLFGKGVGDHGAHVGGMLILRLILELPHHVLVDLVGTGVDGCQQTAARHDGVQVPDVKVVAHQAVQHQTAAEVILLHHPVKGSQVLGGMGQGFGEQGRLAVEHGDLGGGGAGVQN